MALSIRIANATANAGLDAITALLNSGKMRIYSGVQPATANTAISGQTLLAELTFSATAFGASVNGVATANAITQDSSADATGTATWARLVTSAGTTTVLDCSVGTAGTDLIIGTTAIVAAAVVTAGSLTLTLPKS